MCRGRFVGRRRVWLAWWKVLWLRLTGDWHNFMLYVEQIDREDDRVCCYRCDRKGPS